MRILTALTFAVVLGLFGSPKGRAEPVACAGDRVCPAEIPTAADARTNQSSAATKMADLATQVRCPQARVDVTASSSDEHSLACAAAAAAIERLGRCGIALRKPLHVRIMSEVRHPFSGPILGLLDTKTESILVTQEGNVRALVENTPYAALPQREFYRSLIVHEVVHGVMHQNLKRPAVTHAAYEYSAYALQIESLSDAVRETFLQSFDESAKAANAMFHDAILFFNPYYFAARAYHHFKASDNACARLVTLLDGDAPFIAPPQM